MTLHRVLFQPEGKSVQVGDGTTLIEAARLAGIQINSPCGGVGTCGNCRVEVSDGRSAPSDAEKRRLRAEELDRGLRLACQVKVASSMTVVIPDETRLFDQKILEAGTGRAVPLAPACVKEHLKLASPELPDQRADLDRMRAAFSTVRADAHVPLHLIRSLPELLRRHDFEITTVAVNGELLCIEPGDTSARCFGVAVDVGTTTVVGTLIDLKTGRALATASRTNPQVAYGDDVVSRINYAMTEKTGLSLLHAKIVDCVNEIIHQLAQKAHAHHAEIYEVVAVGNTTMTHLLLGIDPHAIAQAPYVAAFRERTTVAAADVGLNIHRCGALTVLPNIAGFVGADTVGVVLATEMHRSDKLKLAVDIGTNGEMVIGTKDRLLTCSTAAGPAFEGARIKFGMRAAQGAIERCDIDDDVHLSLISGDKIVGICGTGLIDIVAELIRLAIVDVTGRIVDADEVPSLPETLRSRIRKGENGNDFILAHPDQCRNGEPVYLTQRDVREVQLAKAAIFAGIQMMKKELHIADEDIDEVLLAGAFGNYLRPERALRLGLLPPIPLERIRFVGNAAAEGAKLALLNRDCRAEADWISQHVRYVELAGDPAFQNEFSMAMMFGEF